MKERKSEYLNTIKLSDNHLEVINKALETYYRLKSGQVNMAMETAYDYAINHDDTHFIEYTVRNSLPQFKDMHPDAAYGVGCKEIGDASLAYEIRKTFQEYLSVKKNDGYYGTTVDFDGPVKITDEPLPVVTNFKNYKEYPLNREQSDKAIELINKKDANKIWDYIHSLDLGLPKYAYMFDIIYDKFVAEQSFYGSANTMIVVRAYKPRKDEVNI